MDEVAVRGEEPLRIGLVLGAGGPVGHAYHAGVLSALDAGLGWDMRKARIVLGTSAGAQVGALLRGGLSGADLARRASGQPLAEEVEAIARHFVRPYPKTLLDARPRSLRPSAPAYLASIMRRPWMVRPGRLISALLPEGSIPLDAQAEGFRRVFGTQWPARELWITAVDLDTGQLMVFGSAGAPAIDVGTAVTCSGAVPSLCRPVHHLGRRYVDGGVACATHVDLLADQRLDAVIVSSPLSMFAPMRALFLRRVRRIAQRFPVFAFEPRRQALRAMGRNPMDMERSAAVVRAAFESTMEELDHPHRQSLRKLFVGRA